MDASTFNSAIQTLRCYPSKHSLLVKKGFLLISHYQNGKGFFIVVRNLDIREKVTLIENYSVSTSNDWK